MCCRRSQVHLEQKAHMCGGPGHVCHAFLFDCPDWPRDQMTLAVMKSSWVGIEMCVFRLHVARQLPNRFTKQISTKAKHTLFSTTMALPLFLILPLGLSTTCEPRLSTMPGVPLTRPLPNVIQLCGTLMSMCPATNISPLLCSKVW